MIHPNSINAYDQAIRPNRRERQKQVLKALKALGPSTVKEVAEYLGMTANQISGRFGELQRLNEIKVIGTQNSVSELPGGKTYTRKENVFDLAA